MPELSKRNVEGLTVPLGAREAYLWDSELPSFGIRKFASGAMSFVVKYSVKGDKRQRKVSFGPASHGAVKRMRELARDTRARVGEDI